MYRDSRPQTTSEVSAGTAAKPEKKFDYIDAVRGWAILLVITTHVGGMFAQMPFPIKKLTNFSWHGVQMFFLASAVTLMMSWHRKHERGLSASRNFFIRRFLRIAPLYYLGGLFYFFAAPPASGFDLAQALRTMLFVNTWHPDWIPTTGGWMVVPGGWSIGVEFTFYALFPLLAAVLTSLPRALGFIVVSVVIAMAANEFGLDWLQGYPDRAKYNFLYFWFPNQLPVFAMGITLYYLLQKYAENVSLTKTQTYFCVASIAIFCVVIAEFPVSTSFFRPIASIPTIFLAASAFMAFIFVVAAGNPGLITHAWIRKIGELSFSAYVIHFFFVHAVPRWSGGLINISATGYKAIGTAAVLWLATVACTVAASFLTHEFIEKPGMTLAKRLTSFRRLKTA